MAEINSFIETGVLVGYCVLLDSHHAKCERYVSSAERDLYTSEGVYDEYEDTKKKVSRRLASAVLDHVRNLKSEVSSEYLGPMEVDELKKNVLDRGNDGFQFLYRYYDQVVSSGVQKQELEKNLREIARDIDRLVESREQELRSIVELWERADNHTSVESALSSIHEPDRTWTVEAHDLALSKAGHTEFATTNPTDFIRDGRKELILKETELDDVIDLSV